VADRWILSRSSRVAVGVRTSLGSYRFDEAAETLYQFTWHEFCDWYLEISKSALSAGGAQRDAARFTITHVLDRLMRLLHPFMPFITEELWHHLPRPDGSAHRLDALAVASYPRREEQFEDEEAERTMASMREVVTARRKLQAEMSARTAKAETLIVPSTEESRRALEHLSPHIIKLTNSSRLRILERFPPGLRALRAVTSGAEVAMPLDGMDVAAERRRIEKEISRAERQLSTHEAKLANEKFLARARPEAVSKVRAVHDTLSARLERLRITLEQLGGR
ncbi:MAG: class I tRNA ligase family protein, partial [Acidobacteriota bacterium]